MGRKQGNGGRARFALWKGEECVDVGSARELAERRGVKVETILFYASAAHKRRDKDGRRLVAERLWG